MHARDRTQDGRKSSTEMKESSSRKCLKPPGEEARENRTRRDKGRVDFFL